MAIVEIEDNGPGMDEYVRKRIFEPFFTTKDVDIGTGLGLSVSYFIVTNNHGGTMEVKSQKDKGAAFIIKLPAFLEDEGFTVFSAASGEEALDLILKQEIDVAIIDMRLPGINGDTLILKAHEIQPVLKFLIHTGSTNYSVSRSLEEIGVKKDQVF